MLEMCVCARVLSSFILDGEMRLFIRRGGENLEKGTFNRSVGESNIRIFVEILLDSRLETKNRKVNSVKLKF